MFHFIFKRILLMIPTLFVISIIAFIIIQLPPGDYVDTVVAQLEAAGDTIDDAEIDALRARYGIDKPIYVQYYKWMRGLARRELGRSLLFNKPVTELIIERLPLSFGISFLSLLFVYAVSIPIGVFSATHQYSLRDYFLTLLGFIGMAIPNFLFALVLLYFYFEKTGQAALGLFSTQYQFAPWSIAKFIDLLKHLWIPIIVVGTAGTCSLIRQMRANLLDELQKPYVIVARSKGLTERKLLYKYPLRIAINPIISTIGWTLPALVNGTLLTSIVLGIPSIAPILTGALLNQDMYLAGSIIFVLSFLTVIGTLISDILLGILDPRIRESVG